MKYIISESKLKQLIKDKFDIDFTGKIEEVTSAYSLLNDFDYLDKAIFCNIAIQF